MLTYPRRFILKNFSGINPFTIDPILKDHFSLSCLPSSSKKLTTSFSFFSCYLFFSFFFVIEKLLFVAYCAHKYVDLGTYDYLLSFRSINIFDLSLRKFLSRYLRKRACEFLSELYGISLFVLT